MLVGACLETGKLPDKRSSILANRVVLCEDLL